MSFINRKAAWIKNKRLFLIIKPIKDVTGAFYAEVRKLSRFMSL